MLTVCVVHGVGYHNDLSEIKEFADRIFHNTGADTTVWPWNHPGIFPSDPRGGGAIFKSIRNFTWEVIMDFAYACKEYEAHVAAVPTADIYIGHSAGGILAMAKADKPCALMGCPLELVRRLNGIQGLSMRPNASTILNLMNSCDPIAAPLVGADNKIVKSESMIERISPVSAHTSYWHSKATMRYIVPWVAARLKELR